MLHFNQNLDSLLQKIGRHRHVPLPISLEQDFRSLKAEGEWSVMLLEQLVAVYGTLHPGEENVKRMEAKYAAEVSHDEYPKIMEWSIAGHTFTKESLDLLSTSGNFFQQEMYYVEEALVNAYGHGNKKDRKKMIGLDSWLGERGMLIRVQDEGEGFAVEEKVKRMRAGEEYSDNNSGNGLHIFWYGESLYLHRASLADYVFGYNAKGNEWFYLTMFGPRTFVPERFNL